MSEMMSTTLTDEGKYDITRTVQVSACSSITDIITVCQRIRVSTAFEYYGSSFQFYCLLQLRRVLL